MHYFSSLGELIECDTDPVGIFSPSVIPDIQMTASSEYSDRYKPYFGRLNGDRGDGWCSKEAAGNDDWLQVDLGKTVQVCAVATQGDINGDEWTTDFKLSFYSDENTWTTYKDGNGAEVVSPCFKKRNVFIKFIAVFTIFLYLSPHMRNFFASLALLIVAQWLNYPTCVKSGFHMSAKLQANEILQFPDRPKLCRLIKTRSRRHPRSSRMVRDKSGKSGAFLIF